MAGKISSCNFRDTITQGKSDIFFNNTDEAIAGKQLTDIVHTEKSLSYLFHHTFCKVGQTCAQQVEIKVYLPYLASAF